MIIENGVCKLTDEELARTFFTADHHFGHENIIKYCKRPFASVFEMDRQLIRNWNKVVGFDDIVFYLGDFTLSDEVAAQQYLSNLNGHVIMLKIPWHHDRRWINKIQDAHTRSGPVTFVGSECIVECVEWKSGNYSRIMHLSHWPIGEWDRKHYGSIHLHGHSHGNYMGDWHHIGELCFDVGVDHLFYGPLDFKPLKAFVNLTDASKGDDDEQ